ncbi:MAG: hypothetical protein U9N14_04175, partial [Pseudomonadota bacterium]|nr:hypothetical protein [Pseudomonadota bacterium]
MNATKTMLLATVLMALTLPAIADEMIPVKRVILSTSGLAHFEHEGNVTGNATLDMSVRLDQVDDMLKS